MPDIANPKMHIFVALLDIQQNANNYIQNHFSKTLFRDIGNLLFSGKQSFCVVNKYNVAIALRY